MYALLSAECKDWPAPQHEKRDCIMPIHCKSIGLQGDTGAQDAYKMSKYITPLEGSEGITDGLL